MTAGCQPADPFTQLMANNTRRKHCCSLVNYSTCFCSVPPIFSFLHYFLLIFLISSSSPPPSLHQSAFSPFCLQPVMCFLLKRNRVSFLVLIFLISFSPVCYKSLSSCMSAHFLPSFLLFLLCWCLCLSTSFSVTSPSSLISLQPFLLPEHPVVCFLFLYFSTYSFFIYLISSFLHLLSYHPPIFLPISSSTVFSFLFFLFPSCTS